ncbi:hypothetical protein BX285_1004 [Streptomyces sp. 1114.5]|uniref:hypothetical protein n=1 Tax=Streptomyces sp. 1114.5 TaxID=1938830 RepID=UPI000F1BE4A8|nr:hypothetical protein [Streptomyces sp. 1114.5]RKT16657.1 hypothetical protein BX285_1004 [Streptomyces sp. 1114.5]
MRNRVPDPRERGRWRRRLPALALVKAVVAALAVVPIGLGAAPQAQADSAVTVPGPKVWIPATKSYGPAGSVTVSQTADLTNQVLQVSWSGFTPTVALGSKAPVAVAVKESNFILYAVRVYQCRGTDPAVTDCYGSTLYGGERSKGFEQPPRPTHLETPEWPTNQVIAATGPDGSGSASIEVWSAKESATLGCDATHPCSLVVEPNYGGDPLDLFQAHDGGADCEFHDLDDDPDGYTAADGIMKPGTAFQNWKTGNRTSEQCAWQHRTVVPLSFAPTADACAAADQAFGAAGLEMANRAVQQWRAGLCLGSSPMTVGYVPAGGEPQARAAFLGGSSTTEVALTALPDRSPPPRPYVYAPFATTGISVTYLVDDPKTGRQIRDMKLNARLVAKLLTQSYASPGAAIPSVAGNPVCLFTDPEFRQLNPETDANGIHWPTSCGGILTVYPGVPGGTTDLTYLLTSWVAADPDAYRFLDGEPDPWGMHIDSLYLKPKFAGYPTDAFQTQDFTGIDQDSTTVDLRHWKQYEWNPSLDGIGRVLRNMMQSQPNCQDPNIDPVSNGHKPCAVQAVGQRAMLAVMDTAQAKAFSLPEAALLNPAGSYVSPSTAGFQAAVADMPTDPATGVQQLPYGTPDTAFSRDPRAYPLSVVQYAMVPTGGLPAAKAAAIAQFLKTVTTDGQTYGIAPGRLAQGYLALTGAQRQQAQEAVQHVAAQDGKLPGNQTAPTNPGTDPGSTAGGTDGGASGSGGTGGSVGGSGVDGNAAGSGLGSADGLSGGGLSGSGLSGAGSTGSTGTGTAGGAASGGPATAGGAKPGATAVPSGAPLAAAPVGTPVPDRPGTARLLLPVALIAGLVLLVGGPAALFLGGTPAGAKVLAGARTRWSRLRRR